MFLISRLQIMALHNVVSKQFYRPQDPPLGTAYAFTRPALIKKIIKFNI